MFLENNEIYEQIKYLISQKGGFTDDIDCNFWRIRIDLYGSSPKEKMFTFHVIILIKSVINEEKVNYYNIYLPKGSYEDKSNTECFQMNVCIL